MDNKTNLLDIVKKVGMPKEIEAELVKKIEEKEVIDSQFAGEIAEELKNISEYLTTLAGEQANVGEAVVEEVDKFGDQLDQVDVLEENLKNQLGGGQPAPTTPAIPQAEEPMAGVV